MIWDRDDFCVWEKRNIFFFGYFCDIFSLILGGISVYFLFLLFPLFSIDLDFIFLSFFSYFLCCFSPPYMILFFSAPKRTLFFNRLGMCMRTKISRKFWRSLGYSSEGWLLSIRLWSLQRKISGKFWVLGCRCIFSQNLWKIFGNRRKRM